MPRQTELADLRITLGREYATAEHLVPLFDRGFNTRYFIVDLGEGKMALMDMHQLHKMGEDITVDLASAASNLGTVNPAVLLQTFHADPHDIFRFAGGLPDATRNSLVATDLCRRKVGGGRVCDLQFHEGLGFVEMVEVKSMGFLKKLLPASGLAFQPDGTLAVKADAPK
ncbi:MAG: hypothetical protein FJ149_11885 [Euryarchaeota archaeon]|nr:hypothetical protein [Euryarchaeota archaeon]